MYVWGEAVFDLSAPMKYRCGVEGLVALLSPHLNFRGFT